MKATARCSNSNNVSLGVRIHRLNVCAYVDWFWHVPFMYTKDPHACHVCYAWMYMNVIIPFCFIPILFQIIVLITVYMYSNSDLFKSITYLLCNSMKWKSIVWVWYPTVLYCMVGINIITCTTLQPWGRWKSIRAQFSAFHWRKDHRSWLPLWGFLGGGHSIRWGRNLIARCRCHKGTKTSHVEGIRTQLGWGQFGLSVHAVATSTSVVTGCIAGVAPYVTEDVIHRRTCRESPSVEAFVSQQYAGNPSEVAQVLAEIPNCTAVDYCASAHGDTWPHFGGPTTWKTSENKS